MFLVVALLLVGAFVQFGHIPNSNGTIIDDLNFLGDQIKSKGLESIHVDLIPCELAFGKFF